MAGKFRFSFGPWNIHEGADPFGPPVRDTIPFSKKIDMYKGLGYDGVQFHDDDAVPDLNNLSAAQIEKEAQRVKKILVERKLEAEFVAPRLWEDRRTIDGAFTSNNKKEREYAIARTKKTIDIARILGTKNVVLWLAREGTYLREAKDAAEATKRIVDAVQSMLNYDPDIRIMIEAKPNEPMDNAYIPTTGHAIAIGFLTNSPERMGCLIESAHAILAGLDPSDEMGFALSYKKLWSVHLNDQNSLKYDQDRSFGSINLRRAFNQVRILDKHNYGQNGEWVGFDVKALRTQKAEEATKHLRNSREVFLKLLEISRSLSDKKIEQLTDTRDYEELDIYIMDALLGKG
jgi:xylose isomerase